MTLFDAATGVWLNWCFAETLLPKWTQFKPVHLFMAGSSHRRCTYIKLCLLFYQDTLVHFSCASLFKIMWGGGAGGVAAGDEDEGEEEEEELGRNYSQHNILICLLFTWKFIRAAERFLVSHRTTYSCKISWKIPQKEMYHSHYYLNVQQCLFGSLVEKRILSMGRWTC